MALSLTEKSGPSPVPRPSYLTVCIIVIIQKLMCFTPLQFLRISGLIG
jgi:hypothetical protein